MDAVLIILAILGFAAVLVSAYVFTVATRNHASNDPRSFRGHVGMTPVYAPVARSSEDRRTGRNVAFPLTVNGLLVAQDRRQLPDRRLAA